MYQANQFFPCHTVLFTYTAPMIMASDVKCDNYNSSPVTKEGKKPF